MITKDSDVHANVPDHIEDGEEESLVVVRSGGGDVSRSQTCWYSDEHSSHHSAAHYSLKTVYLYNTMILL